MKKTVLITGGVRGIGFAIAKAFQAKNYRVVVTYSKDEESALIAKEAGLEVVAIYDDSAKYEQEIIHKIADYKIDDFNDFVKQTGLDKPQSQPE